MRSARRLSLTGLVLLGALAFGVAPALAAERYVFSTGFGSFSTPLGVAVNESTGHVYLANASAGVVENFEASGAPDPTTPKLLNAAGTEPFVFAFPFGVAVDNSAQPSSEGDVYVADLSGDAVDQFDLAGKATAVQVTEASIPLADQGNGSFEPVGVAVNSNGDLFVTDLSNSVVDEFSSAGVFIAQIGSPAQLVGPRLIAIDSSNDLYVTTEEGVVEFDSSGGCVNGCTPFDTTGHTGVAVDGTGDVFVTNEGPRISEYDASGHLIDEFGGATHVPVFGGFSSAFGVAVDSATHALYATDKETGVIDAFKLAVIPTVTTGSASVAPTEVTLDGTVDPEGVAVSACEFEYGLTTSYGSSKSCTTGPGAGNSPVAVGAKLSGLAPGEYHYRLAAGNTAGEGQGADKTFIVIGKPKIGGESISELTSAGARLEAQIDPDDQETSYFFEYATSEAALGTAAATKVEGAPPAPLLAAEFAELPVSVSVTGLRASTTYDYRVIATNATAPAADGTIKQFTTQGAPLVTTGEAQNITRTSTTFSGTVNTVELPTTYQFYYIDEAGYQAALAKGASNPYAEGEATTPTSVTPTDEAQTVGPVAASGMLPGTTYHYALIAKNEDGLTIGPDATVTTLPGTPPLVSTNPASAISQNAATLTGTVTTNGLQTNYGFEIETEPGEHYGPATGLGSIGGAATETVSTRLGELQPGTTYYYRITATNADGTQPGEPVSFTTPGFPTLLTPQSSPPAVAIPNIAFPKEEKVTTGTTIKALTNKQKLAKALKQCKKDKSKTRRQACEKAVKKRYPTAKAKKKGGK